MQYLRVYSHRDTRLLWDIGVLKLRVQIGDKPADSRAFDESKGLTGVFSRLKGKFENTYQIARCNDREHMLLYPSLCHRNGGGRLFCLLGVTLNGLLRKMRCPVWCVTRKQEKNDLTHELTEVRSFGGTQRNGATQSFGVVGVKPDSTHMLQYSSRWALCGVKSDLREIE